MSNLIKIIELSDLVINYSPPKILFPNITFYPEKNPIFIGNNGSGKSSLLLYLKKIIPDYIYAETSNSYFRSIIDSTNLSFKTFCDCIHLIPQQTTYALLGFPPKNELLIETSKLSEWGEYLFNEFEIDKIPDIPSFYLSDGEKKRLAICSVLLKTPSLIFSDEWVSHLDLYWINKTNYIFNEFQRHYGNHISFFSSKPSFISDAVNVFSSNLAASESINFNETHLEYLFNQSHIDIASNIVVDTILFYKRGNFKTTLNGKSGDLIVISGPNGSGKTSILKYLWSKSNIYLVNLYSKLKGEIIPKVFFVPTDPIYHLLGPTLACEIKRISESRHISIVCDFILNVLSFDLNKDIMTFSFGQRKLLSIFFSVMNSFPIIAIDEPFVGVDDKYRKIIISLIEFARNIGKIVIISEHQISIKNESTHIKIQ